jgi:hypothetical protein
VRSRKLFIVLVLGVPLLALCWWSPTLAASLSAASTLLALALLLVGDGS